jgi:peptidoglycan hydrolase-like protein with peptidoglycan-binding domain
MSALILMRVIGADDAHAAKTIPNSLTRGGAMAGDPAVKKMQQALICRGYLPVGADDGILGPITISAIASYQDFRRCLPTKGHWAFSFCLTVDGIYGRRTRARLEPPEIKKGVMNSNAVKLCQEILTHLVDFHSPPAKADWDPQGIDGDFGPLTDTAVRAFQRDNVDQQGSPLKVDGIVGLRTWCALNS